MGTVHVNRDKADFADILESIAAPDVVADLDEAWATRSTRIKAEPVHQSKDWLLQLLDGLTSEAKAAGSNNADAYSHEVAEAERDRAAPASIDEQAEITAELGLTPSLSTAELKRIRRTFAMRNHPDRLHPNMRWEATRRMTIANALIDGLLKSKAH